MILLNKMNEKLPDRPLKPSAFAKELHVSPHRIIRAARKMIPPLELQEGGEIPVFEYERLYEALRDDKAGKL